jgi:predicted Zn-dependent protease
MGSISTESVKKVTENDQLKNMVAEQNAQIYKLYGRVNDLLEDNTKLKADVVELSSQVEKLQ